jgi:hypothetical protein
VFFSILFLFRTFNNPHHVYVMRRYVPAVIPTFAMGMAFAVLRLADWQPVGRVLAAGLLMGEMVLMLYGGRAMIRQVDYQGGVAQIRAFSAQVPSDAVVLFEDGEPIGAGAGLGTPLAYLNGCTVMDLQEDRLDLDRLDTLVAGWLATGRSVVVVNDSAYATELCDRWRCRSLGTARFDLRVLEASYEHLPVEVVPFQVSLDLYVVEEL